MNMSPAGLDLKPKIALATVSGKAYYLLAAELKRRSIPFLSLIPREPVPADIKIVITTEEELSLIRHDQVAVFGENTKPEVLISRALLHIHRDGPCEGIIIGVDPGEAIGLAVLADGKPIETALCLDVREATERIARAIGSFETSSISSIIVRVGNGAPEHGNRLLQALDDVLHPDIGLQRVEEEGTNQNEDGTRRRRGSRDIASAIRIAGRNGVDVRRSTKDRRRPRT